MASMLAQRESSCVFATPVEYLPGTGGGCTVSARGLVNGTSFYILYDSFFLTFFVLCCVMLCICTVYTINIVHTSRVPWNSSASSAALKDFVL